jgi:hypothetical protein
MFSQSESSFKFKYPENTGHITPQTSILNGKGLNVRKLVGGFPQEQGFSL